MWRNKFCLLISVFLATAAAQSAPFPLCIYGITNPAEIKTVKKAGFDCIQTYRTNPPTLAVLAKEAKKHDLQVVFYPDKILGSAYEEQAQTWPVLAWYLADEPDVWNWSRARILEIYNKTKAAFPEHDTALVIGQGKTKTSFYDLPDALMVDWYPVPHLPLVSFGDQLALARQGMLQSGAGTNPLWGVVQIFDWKNYKQHRPDNDRIGRFPTEEEIRFMSYHGIVNGVNGLFYFIFNTANKTLPEAWPKHWEKISNVIRELSRFKAVLENGLAAENPVPIHAPLMAKSWTYQNRRYTVLINASGQAQPLPPLLLERKYKTLYGRKKADLMLPYQVLVFRY